jgi:hypothetical protein
MAKLDGKVAVVTGALSTTRRPEGGEGPAWHSGSRKG